MNRGSWMRQIHRWFSLAFTLAVAANFIALAIRHGQQPPAWVTYSPLLPLAFLLLTGLYLLLLPYVAWFRSRRHREQTPRPVES